MLTQTIAGGEMVDYELIAATDADRSWRDTLRRAAYLGLFNATWGGCDEVRHQRHFGEFLEAGSISIVWVNGKPVGVIQLFDTKGVIEIGEIQISPEHQGGGIGTGILSDVIRRAKQEGQRASLYLGLKNQGAFQLYERLGFQETGRLDTHIFMTHPCE